MVSGKFLSLPITFYMRACMAYSQASQEVHNCQQLVPSFL